MRSFEVRQFGIDQLAETQTEIPRPGRDEVLIRLHAFSLNYRDLMVISGTYNPRMKLPAIPFSDAAGEVVETGEAVTKWKVGDRVSPILIQGWLDGAVDDQKRRTAIGAGADHQGVLAEYVLFREDGVVRIPDNISYRDAAAIPCAGVTAWNALHVLGHLRPGQTVLTLGSGGVSVFAIQIAKMSGAKVITTTGTAEKEERLRETGADDVINYRETEDWDREVLRLTSKVGADHVIEVGGAGTLSRSVNACKVGGQVAMIGALTTGSVFDPVSAFMRSVRLQGIFVGSRKMHEDVLKAYSVNAVKPVIDSEFSFSEVSESLKYMQSGKHFGKIVIETDQA